jgi:hypothetical protein
MQMTQLNYDPPSGACRAERCWRPGWALAFVTLAATCACSGQLAPVGGSQSTGATGGTGVVSGTGGVASTGGTGPVEAGSTQVCHASPSATPTMPTLAVVDPAAVARAAVVLGACIADDGIDRNATHLWSSSFGAPRLYFRYITQLDCLANSNCGCGALLNCLSYDVASGTTSCNPGCQGTRFTACGGAYDMPAGYQLSVDCARLGLQCDTAAACVLDATTACDSSTFTANCSANQQPTFCDDGFVQRAPACSAFGLSCASGNCQGTGAACANQDPSEPESIVFEGLACASNVLTACVSGHQALLDCATVGPGFTCQTVGTEHFCGLSNQCVPANNYAASISNPVACDGNTVVFCNAGRLERLDCLSLGFTGCQVDQKQQQYGCI